MGISVINLHIRTRHGIQIVPREGKGKTPMEIWMQAASIIAACVLVILIGKWKRGVVLFVNFLFRAVLGSLVIYVVDTLLLKMQISCDVGLNIVTVLTCGFLGIPGAAGLFGLRYFLFL